MPDVMRHAHPSFPQCCTQEKHDFVSKIFLASGISTTRTALPKWLLPTYTDEPKTDYIHAQKEARIVYGQVITEVLRKTGKACPSYRIIHVGSRSAILSFHQARTWQK